MSFALFLLIPSRKIPVQYIELIQNLFFRHLSLLTYILPFNFRWLRFCAYDFSSLLCFSSVSSYEPSRLWYRTFYSVVSIKTYVSLPGELPWPTAYLLIHGYHNNITNTNIQEWAPGRGIWTARWPYSLTGLLGASSVTVAEHDMP
jgi:hypothetical protein